LADEARLPAARLAPLIVVPMTNLLWFGVRNPGRHDAQALAEGGVR